MKWRWFAMAAFLLAALLLAGCSPPDEANDGDETPPVESETPVAVDPEEPEEPEDGPGDGEVTIGLAPVDRIEVATLESFPVQVNVAVHGQLPDGCTTIGDVEQVLEEGTFNVTITTERPTEVACTEALVPYDETVALDVIGLPAGTYTVDVNGVRGSFELAVDNVAGEEGPLPTATISGLVWHDLCAIGGGEGGAPVEPSAGCVEAVDGGYAANGVLEEGEPGIAGVEVNLGQGACPSTGLATVTTGEDGTYAFVDLAPGSYCVSVEATSEANNTILLPGSWTYPEPGVSAVTIELAADTAQTNVNFGWDYQFLPAPPPVADCTNRAAFVADVTVPDNSQIQPGTSFVKTWRLRNDGTCAWGPQYGLLFVNGEPMGAPELTPLTTSVPPGTEVDLSVELVAPSAPGVYRGEYQLAGPQGERFGIGPNANMPFWVQIIVP